MALNKAHKLPSLPPWEEAWPAHQLKFLAKTNPPAFARGFQMKPHTDEEKMFPSFGTCFNKGIALAEIIQRRFPIFIGVDLAGPKRKGNVIFVMGVDPSSQVRYPLEIAMGAWTSPETVKRLIDINEKYQNVQVIMVENNGYQQAIIDWARTYHNNNPIWYKIEAFTTGNNKNAPTVGLPSLEIEFKNKMWAIPENEFGGHPMTCKCGWCSWVSQMKDYPHAAFDDCILATWICREGYSKFGVGMPGTGIDHTLNQR